jgi:hypothetical protein
MWNKYGLHYTGLTRVLTQFLIDIYLSGKKEYSLRITIMTNQ